MIETKYPCAEEVSEGDRNEILVSQIVRLLSPLTDRFSKNCQVLKQYPYEVYNEETMAELDGMLEESFYFAPLAAYDASKFDAVEYEKLPDGWYENIALGDACYQRFFKARSVGCGHYVCGALLQCARCKGFYGCRHCHDEAVDDHYFPMFDTTTVKCRYCGEIQPFALQCSGCGRQMGTISCPICRFMCFIDENAKPFFHCDKCNKCQCGSRENYTHCDGCNLCINNSSIKKHICSSECAVCLMSISKHYAAYNVLQCGHFIHCSCRTKCFERGLTACPLCRKTILLGHEIASQGIYFKRECARFRLLNAEIGEPRNIYYMCNDCGRCFYDIPMQANCEHCNTLNCQQLSSADVVGAYAQENSLVVDLDYLKTAFYCFVGQFAEDEASLPQQFADIATVLADFGFRERVCKSYTLSAVQTVVSEFYAMAEDLPEKAPPK